MVPYIVMSFLITKTTHLPTAFAQAKDEFNSSNESIFTVLLEDLFEDAKGHEQSLVFWSSQVGGSTSTVWPYRVNFDVQAR